jgi:pimeloyl-ACP methyl ester carboxylesterase
MALPMPDVVVLLPGIGGSVLARDGKEVWSFSGGAMARGIFGRGKSIKQLQLQGDDPDAPSLGDGVTATRLLDDLHLVPGLWKIDGYSKIGKQIRRSFDVTLGQNYFEFPYDWRRDVRAGAGSLLRQSHDWLAAWRSSSGNPDAKLVLIGHSLGGVVARAFLELMDGWRDTRVLITFGTPFAGSVNAVHFLVNGFGKKVGPFGIDLSDMLRSFTSVYQLLPSFRCLDAGTGDLVRLADGPAVAGLDMARVRAAAEVHAAIRQQVDTHRQSDYEGTGGYGLRPCIGDFQPTRQSVRLDGDGIEVLYTRKGEDEGGDGTVPKLSAVPHELLSDWTNVAAYAEAHASLQNFDPVLVQLSSLLRNLSVDIGGYYAVNARVSVSVEDLFIVGEDMPIRARPEYEVDDLQATVESVATGEVKVAALTPDGDGWLSADMAPLAPGDYRVTVGAPTGVDPVTEVFAVVDPAFVDPD